MFFPGDLYSGGTCSEAEHKLFSVIFSNYNQYIRPVENVSNPVIVHFEVSMSQLVKVVSVISHVVSELGVFGCSFVSFFYCVCVFVCVCAFILP